MGVFQLYPELTSICISRHSLKVTIITVKKYYNDYLVF